MQIHVQLFSILRDCLPAGAQRGRAMISLPEEVTLAGLVGHLRIDRFLGYEAEEMVSQAGWQIIVSGRYESDLGCRLQDGDEVLILPFVSGGQ